MVLMPTTSCSFVHTSEIIVFDIVRIPFITPRRKLSTNTDPNQNETILILFTVLTVYPSYLY